MGKPRIEIAKPQIFGHFEAIQNRVFKPSEIATIFTNQRLSWRLAKKTTKQQFIDFLIDEAALKRFHFPFPYRSETRYVWGEIPLLEILLTLKKDAYFTHHTALHLHGLTESKPKVIYLNHEQRAQLQDFNLEQGRITAAFSRRPRTSQNYIDFDDARICMVNGMYTNQLGVLQANHHYGGQPTAVRVTNIERTLIDISVRPVYAGGVQEVFNAFLLAKNKVSIPRLVEMLKKLKYVYPYHQAIGFYLERAEYASSDINLLKELPMEFDFYLAHEMGETGYITKWRLHVPKSFT